MKRIVPFIFILTIILSGCGSSKKQLQKGNYNAAIDKAVKQLRKDPGDVKQIAILDQSYKVANDQDNERIRYLKMVVRCSESLKMAINSAIQNNRRFIF